MLSYQVLSGDVAEGTDVLLNKSRDSASAGAEEDH